MMPATVQRGLAERLATTERHPIKAGERVVDAIRTKTFYAFAGAVPAMSSRPATAASGLVPQHPRQPGGRRAGRDPQDEGAGQDRHRRGARAAVGEVARVLAALRRLPEEDRAPDPGGGAGSCRLTSALPAQSGAVS